MRTGALAILAMCAALQGCASMIGGTREETQREELQAITRIASHPPGAAVFIDDAWVGVTPLTIPLGYDRVVTETYKDLHVLGYVLDLCWLFPIWPLGLTFFIYDAAEDGDFVSRRSSTEARSHVLRVSKDGYEEVVRTVRVPFEHTVHVTLREPGADPPPQDGGQPLGHLHVGSDPPGLGIVIEGANGARVTTKAITPIDIALPVGRYTVRVADTRFVERASTIDVKARAEVRLELAPRPKP